MTDQEPDDDVEADEKAGEVLEAEHPEEYGVLTAEKAAVLIAKEIG